MDAEKLLLLSTLTAKARKINDNHDQLLALVNALQTTADQFEDADQTKKLWAVMFKLYSDLVKTANS